MATIKDIANLSGFSRGTVDRVLNNRGEVNPQTREKILAAAQTLGYRPNRAGLALAAQKKKYKIGVILFREDNPFTDQILTGVSRQAQELEDYGLTTITKHIPFDAKLQLEAIDDLLAQGIHGLLLTPYNHPDIIAKIDALMDAGIPVVTVNTDIEGSKRLAYVGSDYIKGGSIAAGLLDLMTSGPVQLGIVTGSFQILCHSERIRGLCDTLHTAYPRIRLAGIIENNDDEIVSYNVTKALLLDHPEINALFFTAAGVYGGCRAIQDLGLSPTIISFDEVPTTIEMLKAGVISATISQQPLYQGSTSLNLLFEHLTSGIVPESDCLYATHSIIIKENIS